MVVLMSVGDCVDACIGDCVDDGDCADDCDCACADGCVDVVGEG